MYISAASNGLNEDETNLYKEKEKHDEDEE